MNVEPAAEAEFNEWYDTEHIPALAAVPSAMLCARRFRATSANRRYVALYHLASPEVQTTPGLEERRKDTEWTRKLRPHFQDHLRLVCKAYVRARLGAGTATAPAVTKAGVRLISRTARWRCRRSSSC